MGVDKAGFVPVQRVGAALVQDDIGGIDAFFLNAIEESRPLNERVGRIDDGIEVGKKDRTRRQAEQMDAPGAEQDESIAAVPPAHEPERRDEYREARGAGAVRAGLKDLDRTISGVSA